jgi:hypothetical protein
MGDIMRLFLPTVAPTTPTTTTLHRLAMGRKKNDHEASSSHVKEEKPWIRVPLLVSVAPLLYDN